MYDLVLALRSRIFEYLREVFRRRALGYLEPPRLEKNEKYT